MRLGAQFPRVLAVPDSAVSFEAGLEAAELAESVGLVLDSWQQFALVQACAERVDQKWAAFEVGLVVPRQNGKGAVIEARELAGLFLFGEQLIIHTAHEYKTAAEAFLRVSQLIENSDSLRPLVKSIRTSHGEEGIELRSGARLRFLARSKGSGRGFSCDCLILDEALFLGAEAMRATIPTMSARTHVTDGGPQVFYTSSPGYPVPEADHLRNVRERALAGGQKRLCYMEWSAPDEARSTPQDPEWWYLSNPALGIRIEADFVEGEFEAFGADPEGFAVERLGIWPDPAGADGLGEFRRRWISDGTADHEIVGVPTFAVEVAWDRSAAAIGVCGVCVDGVAQVEVAEYRAGTQWVAGRVAELAGKWRRSKIWLDPGGPAGSLLPDLVNVPLELMTTRQAGQAHAYMIDGIVAGTIRHRPDEPLDLAVAGSKRRPLGDAFAWDRKAAVDMCPLTAVTAAAFAHSLVPPRTKVRVISMKED